ncbi:hypothetical protein [Variovorax paradoxus]|uniref:hypothetical protein n=1 Tax=Variovorax paradoxus TaxID=34073 RepID=UPI000A713B06|nr:hypothetical protein [Variovorax paradoxus]
MAAERRMKFESACFGQVALRTWRTFLLDFQEARISVHVNAQQQFTWLEPETWGAADFR